MIRPHCFAKEWIDSFKTQDKYRKINPPLLEKMIHALSLLQYLQKHGLNFIFKGGTSLILLLKNANRFSVDIDIITEESRQTIERVLDDIVKSSHFKAWKLDEKRSYKEGVPKAHYELEYDSNVNKNSNYILIDILFEKSHYPKIEQRAVQSPWIETETVIEIPVPSIEAITGDKLTAFAPTTTGILYGKGKEMEIIKQLFDLGTLFDHVEDLSQVASSFTEFSRQEITYRNLKIQSIDILHDTLDTCRIICFRDRNRTEPDKSRYAELQNGIRGFGNFLITGRFTIDEAITAASKVAYFCAKLIVEDYSVAERYAGQDIQNWEIKNQQWNILNRLKRLPDQAGFYYWYKCHHE